MGTLAGRACNRAQERELGFIWLKQVLKLWSDHCGLDLMLMDCAMFGQLWLTCCVKSTHYPMYAEQSREQFEISVFRQAASKFFLLAVIKKPN